MMTEDEAKTKWCPASREICNVGDMGFAANRDYSGKPLQGSVCLGSGCMMWRWRKGAPPELPPEQRQGYCGLANLPPLNH